MSAPESPIQFFTRPNPGGTVTVTAMVSLYVSADALATAPLAPIYASLKDELVRLAKHPKRWGRK